MKNLRKTKIKIADKQKEKMNTIFYAQRISFDKQELTMGIDEKVKMELKVYPKEAKGRPVIWQYSDNSVIEVDETGMVTAIGQGTAQIIAECDYGKTFCEIMVEKGTQKTDVPDIVAAVLENRKMILDYSVLQGDGTLAFESENRDIAEVVGNNSLRLKQIGDTYIHCRCSETENYKPDEKRIKLMVRQGIKLQPEKFEIQNVENGIELKWSRLKNVDGYFIYRIRGKEKRTLIANIAGIQDLVFLDEDVQPGISYTYFVQAYSKKQICILPENGITQVYLQKVELDTISSGNKAIHLEWKSVTGAEGYYIYRKRGAGEWKVLSSVPQAEELRYDDSEIESGQEYTYIISAYNGESLGAFDLCGWNIRYLDVPQIESIENGINTVTIRWNKIAGAQGYYIYKRNKNMKWKMVYQAEHGNTTFYTDKSVESGEEYIYTVRACYSKQLSDYDRYGERIVYLDCPNLQGVEKVDDHMCICWNKVKGAIGYKIYRKKTGGKWQRIGILHGNSISSFQDPDINADKTYLYTVRACSKKSMSTFDMAGVSYENENI